MNKKKQSKVSDSVTRFLIYQVRLDQLNQSTGWYISPEAAFEYVDRPFWRELVEHLGMDLHFEVKYRLQNIGEVESILGERGNLDVRWGLRDGLSDLDNILQERVTPLLNDIDKTNHGFSTSRPTLDERNIAHSLKGRRLVLSEIETAYRSHGVSLFQLALKQGTGLRGNEQNAPLKHIEQIEQTSFHQKRIELLRSLQRLYLFGYIDWLSPIGYYPNGYGQLSKAYCRRCGYNENELQLNKEHDYGHKSVSNNRSGTLGKQVTLKKLISFTRSVKHMLKAKLWAKESTLIPLTCQTCQSDNCLYCPRCLQLGIAKSCEPYVYWKRSLHFQSPNPSFGTGSLSQQTVTFEWKETLSPAQQQASDQLLTYIQKHKKSECSHKEHSKNTRQTLNQHNIPQNQNLQYKKCSFKEHKPTSSERSTPSIREYLVWAICGAGKTEIIFASIYDALLSGQKVLITSPRKDVILELAPRLKAAFPSTSIVVLHGDSQEKYEQGELFLATTHQCLRFYQFFDLVIIDEVDAFPYSYDQMLQHAVSRAKKKEGMLVYLSATPSEKLQQRAEKGTLPHALISKRYHGHPLAVPRIQAIGNWRKWMNSQLISSELSQFIAQLIQQKRYGYLFVPHVKDLPLVQAYLQDIVLPYLQQKGISSEEPFTIEAVYAEHPDRTEIVQHFRQHQIQLLLTTTILERGVTIPFCDVAVLGSDDAVFHTAALIQMAGRAGRKIQDPVGAVFFFPEAVTNSQVKCVQQIKRWNKA